MPQKEECWVFCKSYRSLNLLAGFYKWKHITFIEFFGWKNFSKQCETNIVTYEHRKSNRKWSASDNVTYDVTVNTKLPMTSATLPKICNGLSASDFLHGAIINHTKAISFAFLLQFSIKMLKSACASLLLGIICCTRNLKFTRKSKSYVFSYECFRETNLRFHLRCS